MRKHRFSVLFFLVCSLCFLGATSIRPVELGQTSTSPDYQGFLITGFRFGKLPAPFILNGPPLSITTTGSISSFFTLYQDIFIFPNLELELLVHRPGNLYIFKENNLLMENVRIDYAIQWAATDEISIGIVGSGLADFFHSEKIL